jgi:hypothetical protein
MHPVEYLTFLAEEIRRELARIGQVKQHGVALQATPLSELLNFAIGAFKFEKKHKCIAKALE